MPSAKPRRTAASAPKNGPSEIAPGVFVGGWQDAVAFEGTRFCVLDEEPAGMPAATHIPIYNETSGAASRRNLDRLAREVSAARAQGQPVLIFCGHGIRRSPLGGAWYLHRAEKLPLEAAYERIRAVRPKVETAASWVDDPSSLGEP